MRKPALALRKADQSLAYRIPKDKAVVAYLEKNKTIKCYIQNTCIVKAFLSFFGQDKILIIKYQIFPLDL